MARLTSEEMERRKKVVIEHVLKGYPIHKACLMAGYKDQYQAGKRLGNDPDVIKAIRKAAEDAELTRARIILGILEIAEDPTQSAPNRLQAYKLLATVQGFIDDKKYLLLGNKKNSEIAVVFGPDKSKKEDNE